MKVIVGVIIFFGWIVPALADQMIESVQQTLKDQGFYYGEITGEPSANLTAAIRRYQIRNGLTVSGELNSETLQSLGIDSSGVARRETKPSPSPGLGAVNPSDQSARAGESATPAPVQPFANAPQDQQVNPSSPVYPSASPGAALLPGTPYETAPPDVQHKVMVSAQIALARRGLYREEIDGAYSSAMEFSLRAYQTRTHLPVTGRLDLETLAALRLLPPPREPVYDPSRRRFRPPPPVRGEWIPE
jgi:peptidoglycan hydrolase-like protein with peptidoglycan-binding domain